MSLHLRAPEDVHHLLGGVGAGGVPLPAHDLALGGKAELGGQVVLGLGRRGVHLVLLGLAVAEKTETDNQTYFRQCWANIISSVIRSSADRKLSTVQPRANKN